VRKFCLVAFAALMLVAVSAFASDGVAPPTNNVSPHDRLVGTPMSCMMPPLPSLYLGGGTPLDSVKMGVTELSDFVQDTAIYLGCLGAQAKIMASNLSMKFMDYLRSKRQAARQKDEYPGN
jgi:hypothetical protein